MRKLGLKKEEDILINGLRTVIQFLKSNNPSTEIMVNLIGYAHLLNYCGYNTRNEGGFPHIDKEELKKSKLRQRVIMKAILGYNHIIWRLNQSDFGYLIVKTFFKKKVKPSNLSEAHNKSISAVKYIFININDKILPIGSFFGIKVFINLDSKDAINIYTNGIRLW